MTSIESLHYLFSTGASLVRSIGNRKMEIELPRFCLCAFQYVVAAEPGGGDDGTDGQDSETSLTALLYVRVALLRHSERSEIQTTVLSTF